MRVLVVGAGILGASAAWTLVQRGAQVVVVDEAHQGKATMAGAGIVCPWATAAQDADWYRLYEAGARHYAGLVAGLQEAGETDLGYARVGALVVANDPADVDACDRRLQERLPTAPEAGEPHRLTPAEARALFPPLRADLGALHIPGAARVDARRFAAAMLRAAAARGATLIRDHVTLEQDGARLLCRRSGGSRVEADEIIVTAGAWAAQILRPLGLDHPVQPQRGQIVHLSLPGTRTAAWPVVLPQNGHYMLSFDDSRVVIGATRETGSGFDYRVTAGGLYEVLRAGLDIAPGLAEATHIETRIGFRPAAATIRPILGRVPGRAGLIIGNGLGASGLTIGPYAGRLLASIALGEALAEPLGAFAPVAAAA